MARPRKFDEETVLHAASDLFWTKGYEATSTRDLASITGLTASSIYGAFGDKRGLYLASLEHYLTRLRLKIAHLEEALPPELAITGFFVDTIERSVSDPLQRGCMLVNSALESTPEDISFCQAISKELKLIESFFQRCFMAAQANGVISSSHSADKAAQQLLTVLIGIRVLARVRPEPTLLEGAVGQTLESFYLPPLSAVPHNIKDFLQNTGM